MLWVALSPFRPILFLSESLKHSTPICWVSLVMSLIFSKVPFPPYTLRSSFLLLAAVTVLNTFVQWYIHKVSCGCLRFYSCKWFVRTIITWVHAKVKHGYMHKINKNMGTCLAIMPIVKHVPMHYNIAIRLIQTNKKTTHNTRINHRTLKTTYKGEMQDV